MVKLEQQQQQQQQQQKPLALKPLGSAPRLGLRPVCGCAPAAAALRLGVVPGRGAVPAGTLGCAPAGKFDWEIG